MGRFVSVMVAVCFVLLAALFVGKDLLQGFDIPALAAADIVLALLSILSFFLIRKNTRSGRPQAFVNGVYSATLLRLMVCLTGIFIYAYSTRAHLHKPTVFLMMGFYVVYTFTETLWMARQAKK